MALLASLALMLLAPLAGWAKGAAKALPKPEFYLRWSQLPSQVLRDMGKRYLYQQDKPDSALLCYTIVANRYYEQELSGQELNLAVDAMNDVGYMYYFHYHNYQQSYNTLLRARHVAEKHRLKDVMPYIHMNLAALFLTSSEIYGTDNHDKVLETYRQALDGARQNGDWPIYVNSFSTYIAYAYEKGRYAEMDQAIAQYDSLALPADMPLRQFSLHEKNTYHALRNADYRLALACCDSMLQSIDLRDQPERLIINVKGLRAYVLSLMGQGSGALQELLEAEHIAQTSGTVDMLPQVYHYIWDYYRDVDAAQADHYELCYLRAKDAVLMNGQLGNITQMRFLDELQQVNEEVQEMASRQRLYLFAGITAASVAMLFLLMLIIIVRLYRHQKRKNRLLYENRVELLAREQDLRRQRDEAIRQHEQQAIFAMESAKIDAQEPKYQSSQLDDVSREIIRDRVEQAMSRPELFCQEGFSINQLAEQVGANYKYVSQVVNEHYERNFSQLLAECRINEACRRLHDDPHFRQLKVEAIAEAVGFKSRTNFAASFKRITGLSPSEYIRQAAQVSD